MKTIGIQARIVKELKLRGRLTTLQLFESFPDYDYDINAFTANLTNMLKAGKVLRVKQPCKCCRNTVTTWMRTL